MFYKQNTCIFLKKARHHFSKSSPWFSKKFGSFFPIVRHDFFSSIQFVFQPYMTLFKNRLP